MQRVTGLVSIVIPTFNRLDLTRDCLDGIRRTTAPGSVEIVVVDNRSTDGTRDYLAAEQRAGRIRCLLNEENIGFGKACNRAVETSTGEFVLLLNNDIVPLPGWLDAMLAELADPTVGIVGSRLLYPDGTIQHAGADFTPNRETEHVHRSAPGDDPAVTVSRDYPVVTGASMLLRRDLYDRLGGFDEGFWMYVEDVDLCVRAWHAGYRVRYCADSVLIHFESQSSPTRDWCSPFQQRGWERFHERWLGRMPAGLLAVTRVPEAISARQRFTVAARASELAADPLLLAAYAATFSADDHVTLAILDEPADGGVSATLMGAVTRAGLTGDRSPDMVAVPVLRPVDEELLACGTDAVFSAGGLGGAFADLPLFDATQASGLRAYIVETALAQQAAQAAFGASARPAA